MKNSPIQIAIIGSGLSGTLTAINLVKAAKGPVHILLIEKSPGQLNRGVAYHTDNLFLPLNVPVKKMSLFSADHDHFYNWLQTHKDNYPAALPDTSPGAFISRGIYGDYLENTFRDAIASAENGVTVTNIIGEVKAINIINDIATLQLDNGTTLQADKVILALGNFPPVNIAIEDTLFYRSNRYVALPWNNSKEINAIEPTQDVLILGSGLSMVDVLITLNRNKHRGKVNVLSLHGLLPKPHAPASEINIQLPTQQATALGLFNAVRNEIRKANESGHDWRSVMDSLRVQTPKLWQSLATAEKRKFLRSLRTLWDVHRHRIPQSSQQLIDDLIGEGRFNSFAGRVVAIQEIDNKAQVLYRPKGQTQLQQLTVDKVINCTGPHPNFSHMPSALIRQLLDSGQGRLDELNMGFEIDERGALIDTNGAASTQIFTIGPMRKGAWWESTALREIRQQAEELPGLIY